MRTNVDFKDNIFFNEKLSKVLPYQIKSYDAVFPLTNKEYEKMKRIYWDVVFFLNVYKDKVEEIKPIQQLIEERPSFFDFYYYDLDVFYERSHIKDAKSDSLLPIRWRFPLSSATLNSAIIEKLKVLSELEFKGLILGLLKKAEINLNEKQVQFLLYFLELDVFYGTTLEYSENNFELFELEKPKDLIEAEKITHPFNYQYMTSKSEFEKKYYSKQTTMYSHALSDTYDSITSWIEDWIPVGEKFTKVLNDKIDQQLWNQCKEEYPELYDIHKLHKVTPLVKEYYMDMKDYLQKMLEVIADRVENCPEINQIQEDLIQFSREHFEDDSTYSLFYINQRFMNNNTGKFNDYITKYDSESEIHELFILYKSYNKFRFDPEISKIQKAYLEKYYKPLYGVLLKRNKQNIKKEFEYMLHYYLTEIEKFTLNSNSITGIKLETQFKAMTEKLLMPYDNDPFKLYFDVKNIKCEKLPTLTEWFDLAEKMSRKYDIDNKKEYKKYILKP